MPVILHRQLQWIICLTMGLLILGILKINHLSDPSDVNTKKLVKNSKDPAKTNSNNPKSWQTKDHVVVGLQTKLSNSEDSSRTKTSTPKKKKKKKRTDESNDHKSVHSTMTPKKERSSMPSKQKKLSSSSIQISKEVKSMSASNDMEQESRNSFLNQYCTLEQSNSDWWYPDRKHTNSWQLRSPHAVWMGTDRLTSILQQVQHPFSSSSSSSSSSSLSIPLVWLPDRPTSMFLPRNFRYFRTRSQLVKAWSARQRLYATYPLKAIKANSHMYAMESSPGYLFWSSIVPQQILCTCPWIKVVILLQNPLDRLIGQYQLAKSLGLRTSIENWLQEDWNLVHDTITRSSKESNWTNYLTQAAGDSPIGRGLYIFQIKQWLSMMSQFNKKEDVLILDYESWRQDPDVVLLQILEFLQLSSEDTTSLSLSSEKPSKNSIKLDPKLRKKISQFYKPYNQMLYELLRWNPIWESDA
jgi:Sulfotransferase domain